MTTQNDTMNDTALNAWNQLVREQIERLDTAFDEAARRHQQMLSQVNGTVDELTKLVKDSMALQTQLTSEWMKIARGTTQRAGEFVNSMATR